jgi:hypothetical protein
MPISRVDFVKVCGLALCGVSIDTRTADAFFTASPAVATSRPFRWQDVAASVFRPHVNTSFDLRSTDGVCTHLVLAEVTERPRTKNVEQFSVIFHAPPGCSIPDGIHTLQHPSLGQFELFIAPVGASKARRTVYQACFSRHAVMPGRT